MVHQMKNKPPPLVVVSTFDYRSGQILWERDHLWIAKQHQRVAERFKEERNMPWESDYMHNFSRAWATRQRMGVGSSLGTHNGIRLFFSLQRLKIGVWWCPSVRYRHVILNPHLVFSPEVFSNVKFISPVKLPGRLRPCVRSSLWSLDAHIKNSKTGKVTNRP